MARGLHRIGLMKDVKLAKIQGFCKVFFELINIGVILGGGPRPLYGHIFPNNDESKIHFYRIFKNIKSLGNPLFLFLLAAYLLARLSI
ncbi:MAG: hypothetical protein LBE27_03835 [Deltaproteobacteria bacterium]|nr:hypothetical protein [Deltaproteobacteria bacterium]